MTATRAGLKAKVPAARINLDDRIYSRLKAMIADGTLLPGERLVPDQLAREMGTSRTPMLNALKRLGQERLVEWRPRRGVFIHRPSKLELAQTFELREVMEGLVARRAAMVIEPAQVDALAALFDGILPDETPQSRRRYMRSDYRFHSSLMEIAASLPLRKAVETINVMVFAFSGGLIRTISEGMKEHEAVFAALRRRDPDAAETAMRLHIRRSVERLYQEAEAESQDREGCSFAAATMSNEPELSLSC